MNPKNCSSRVNQRLHRLSAAEDDESMLTVCWPNSGEGSVDLSSVLMDEVIEIRRATTDETDEIADLLQTHRLESHAPIIRTKIEAAIRGLLADPARGFIAVARAAEECAGMAFVSMTWTIEHGGSSAWLEELYVPAPFRDLSIGTQLLQYVFNECRILGCETVDGEIDTGLHRLRSLYERNKFQLLTRQRVSRSLRADDETPYMELFK